MATATARRPSAAVVQAAEVIADRVRADPEWFAATILGDDLWEQPRAILRALARPRARVAVKACHASGKTHTAARAVLWWVVSGGIAVTTAPTWTQVKELLWSEVHKAHANARFPLGGTLLQTEYRLGPDNYAIGLSTDQGVRFQGWHGRVLIVMDEAPGVKPDIWEAIEGIRAGGDVRILALGNPTIASGRFHDAFDKDRAGWATFTIDAFDAPNLAGLTLEQLLALPDGDLDIAPRPYLVTRRWVKERHEEWGPLSPLWAARVRGRFPEQAEDALLSLAWLEEAGRREIEPGDSDDWEAGIDVSGPGEDETALVVRHGPKIAHRKEWGEPDPRGAVLAELAPFQEKLKRIKVDSVGLGYYFARHLEDHGYRGKIVDVNVGEAATDKEKYANLKAELYWGLRQRFRDGGVCGLTDQRTVSQLAGIRYQHNARGQVVIESKDDARKRGVKSPDRAEAVLLAFAPPGPADWDWGVA
jgi:phage terminase large subunit